MGSMTKYMQIGTRDHDHWVPSDFSSREVKAIILSTLRKTIQRKDPERTSASEGENECNFLPASSKRRLGVVKIQPTGF